MLTPYGVGVSILVRVLGRPFFALDSTHVSFFWVKRLPSAGRNLLFNLNIIIMKTNEIFPNVEEQAERWAYIELILSIIVGVLGLIGGIGANNAGLIVCGIYILPSKVSQFLQ